MARLDGFSIFGGIVFVVVIFFVIYPISFPLPLSLSRLLRNVGIRLRLLDPPDSHTSSVELDALPKQLSLSGSIDDKDNKPIRVRIGLSSVPLLGVLLLLITTTIGGNEIAKGIVGEHGVRPYDVLVLFISLAYIATALDATGGLRYLAFQVALRAKSGNQLYLFLYSFFFLSGAVIGNDPIILSGTPFLAYLTRVSGITPPTAWIYAQFLAANVSSAILVSSNPTNVLVAGAFELNFLSGFTKYTILPAVVAAIVVYPVLFYTFKSKRITLALDKTASSPEGRSKQELIPSNFDKPDVDPRSTLVDAQGAIFHTVLLLVTLAVLVGTSFLGVEVWMITAPAAVVGLIRDVFYDLHSSRQAKRVKSSPPPEAHANGQPLHKTPRRVTVPSLWRSFSRRLPSTSLTLSRLPWPLLPFAVGMFILVRSLDRLGYIGIFAEWTARACTSPAAAVFFVGAIVALGLCPLCGTNIGATILAVEVLNNDSFLNAPHVQADPRILRGAIYAVALASNTGALVTLPSSLAGLLWSRILQQKGIRITQTSFSLINFIPVCIVTFVALAIILVEVLYWD